MKAVVASGAGKVETAVASGANRFDVPEIVAGGAV